MSNELNSMYKTADEVEKITDDAPVPYAYLGDEVHRTLMVANRLGMKYLNKPFYSNTFKGYEECKKDMESVDRLLTVCNIKPSIWQRIWHAFKEL